MCGLAGANSLGVRPAQPAPGHRPHGRAEVGRRHGRHDAARRVPGEARCPVQRRARDLRRRGRVRAAPPPLRAQQPLPPGARGARHGAARARRPTGCSSSSSSCRRRCTRSSSRRRRTPSSRAARTGRTRCSRRSSKRPRQRAEGRLPRLPIPTEASDRAMDDRGWRRCRGDVPAVECPCRVMGPIELPPISSPARRARRLARGRTRPRRELAAPRTGAISAATPRSCATAGETDPAAIGEDDRAGLRPLPRARSPTTTVSALLAPSSIARALVAVRSFHGFCAAEGLLPTDPSEEVDAPPRARRGSRRRSTKTRSSRCSARSPATARSPNATGRCSRLLYAPASASARRSGSTSATSTSRTASCACSARATRNASCPSAAARDACCTRISRDGRLALRSARRTRRGRRRRGVPQRARRAHQPSGVLVDRAQRGRAGRARRAPLAARAAALVRDAHARPRRRSPCRAGAARPRQHLDDPGVHEGLARTAASRLRRRSSASASLRPVMTLESTARRTG